MPSFAPGYPASLRPQRDPKPRLYRNIGGVKPPGLGTILRWGLGLGPKEMPMVDLARVEGAMDRRD